MVPLGAYPIEYRLRSAIICILLFELVGCIYQFFIHVWWAASMSLFLAFIMAFIGLYAAYKKSEGGLLFYAILQMVAIVIQLANVIWVVAAVWLVKGKCDDGWHCHGWRHARGWALAIFVLSVAATGFYILLKIFATSLALRLRHHVHAAHIAEAFIAPRQYEAAYQSYLASQTSYQQPPRSPLVMQPEATTYGTGFA